MTQRQLESTLGIRVASFNVRYDTSHDGVDAWPHRREHVVKYIRDTLEPTVIGLQEPLHHQLKEILEGLGSNFHYVGVGREDGHHRGEFSPIVYDKRVLEVKLSGTFWLSDTPDKAGTKFPSSSLPRIVTWAKFKFCGLDTHFFFYNTHFDHQGEEARTQSARCLAWKLVENVGGNQLFLNQPTVLTGDFNCESTSDVFHILNRDTPMRNVCGLADKTYNESLPTFTGFGNKGGITIDYIYTCGFRVTSYSVAAETRLNGRMLSDHRPIFSDLVFI